MNRTFEQYLQDRHAEEYVGLDDEMPDAFNEWLCELDPDYYIKYAEDWAKTLVPIEPAKARPILDCITELSTRVNQHDITLNRAYDALKNGQNDIALKLIAEILNYSGDIT